MQSCLGEVYVPLYPPQYLVVDNPFIAKLDDNLSLDAESIVRQALIIGGE